MSVSPSVCQSFCVCPRVLDGLPGVKGECQSVCLSVFLCLSTCLRWTAWSKRRVSVHLSVSLSVSVCLSLHLLGILMQQADMFYCFLTVIGGHVVFIY